MTFDSLQLRLQSAHVSYVHGVTEIVDRLYISVSTLRCTTSYDRKFLWLRPPLLHFESNTWKTSAFFSPTSLALLQRRPWMDLHGIGACWHPAHFAGLSERYLQRFDYRYRTCGRRTQPIFFAQRRTSRMPGEWFPFHDGIRHRVQVAHEQSQPTGSATTMVPPKNCMCQAPCAASFPW